MATHSSVLTWRILGTGEPGGLPSMGSTESATTAATWQQQQQEERATQIQGRELGYMCANLTGAKVIR